MSFDPNFPDRNLNPQLPPTPDTDPANRGWALGIGVLVVLAIIAFLATGKLHDGDQIANVPPPPPASSAATNPLAATPSMPAPRNPAETTGTAPRQ